MVVVPWLVGPRLAGGLGDRSLLGGFPWLVDAAWPAVGLAGRWAFAALGVWRRGDFWCVVVSLCVVVSEWCAVAVPVAGLCGRCGVVVRLVCGGGGVPCLVGMVCRVCGGLAPCNWCACAGGCCWPGLVGVACVSWCRVLGCRAVWHGVFVNLGLPVVVCPLWCGVGAAGSYAGGGPPSLPSHPGVRWQCPCVVWWLCLWLLPPAGVDVGVGGFVAPGWCRVLVGFGLVIPCRPLRGAW